MLGIIFIYYIGKAFYDLAGIYNRHKWGYAIGGLAVYYGSQLAIGMAVGAWYLSKNQDIEKIDNLGISLIGVLIAGLITWGFYKYLQHVLSKEEYEDRYIDQNQIDEIGKDIDVP
jgi:hypothetical protein